MLDKSKLTQESRERPEHRIIDQWIYHGSRVLDLGCGDGDMMRRLMDRKAVTGYGVEIDVNRIHQCLSQGVPVVHADFDKGLGLFPDQAFDVVIMNSTLQASRDSGALIDELFRVARSAVVTFPNFGHFSTRLYLGFKGRMPMSKALPHQWYNTPNIHLCTFSDFEQLCVEKRIHIKERTVVDSHFKDNWLMRRWPNLFGEVAIYHLAKLG